MVKGRRLRAAHRCRSDELDVFGDDLAAVAIVAVGILPARVVQAAGDSELVALRLVLAERKTHAVEDGDLVKLGVRLGVAGFRILLDAAVADDCLLYTSDAADE